MSFNTYTALQTEIAGWLNRADLAVNIPSFITLAETEIKRIVRRTTVTSQVTMSQELTALPGDCAVLRSLRLVSGLPEIDYPIKVGTIEQLTIHRARYAGVAGRPQWAAVYGGNIRVTPIPDSSYIAELTYYQLLQPLSSTNATNTVLAEYPDLYLYGALCAAAPFLEEDTRVPLWRQAFDRAVDQIRIVVDDEEYNASLKQAKLRVFI